MRNTIAPVFLQAGFRVNVIPGSAAATLNLRLIPGTERDKVITELKNVIGDPDVDITPALTNTPVSAAKPSSTDTDLYRALVAASKKLWPHAPVTAYLFQAGTDAIAWRSRGVPVYGIYPYPISDDDLSRMHGNNERMSIQSLDEGTDLIYRTLLAVAAR
jgi:acetylornithine deacetylase/succinyl-diaminopimelate desuccinylase-like protein